MALVAVLWILVLLSSIAGSYAYGVRTELNLTRNAVQSARARLLAEAGINRAIAELLLPPGDRRWASDGTAERFTFGDGEVRVRIQSAAGLVDLNRAPPALLEGLFSVLEVAPARRAQLVDAILDWRDTDDLRRLNGAEARDYRLAGFAYAPANRPFAHVGELDLVLGMTRDLYRRVRPWVTVHSNLSQVNGALAPATVLLALHREESVVEALLAERVARHRAMRTGGAALTFPAATGAYHLTAQGLLPDGSVARLEAVVRLGARGRASEPYRVLDWREGTEPAPARQPDA